MLNNESWKNRTVAITGINGCIGRHLAERLHGYGANVRGMDIAGSPVFATPSPGLDIRQGSIEDSSHDRWLLEGVDVLVHCAAVVAEDGDLDTFRAINVGSTVRLARQANHFRVHDFIYLSTVMVYGFHYRSAVTERGPMRDEGNPYCLSRIESERAIAHILDENSETRLTRIRPGDTFGAGSKQWVLRAASLLDRGLLALPNRGLGTMNAVYIDNLIDAILLCSDRLMGSPSIYNIIDTHISWYDYLHDLASGIGAKPPRRIPGSVMKAGFEVAQRLGLGLGLSSSAVDFLAREHPVSSEQFHRVFDYTSRVSYREGLQRTVDWLVKNPQVWQ